MALWLWYRKNTGSAIYRSVTAIAELVVAVDSDVYIAGCMAMCVCTLTMGSYLI